MRIRHLMWAFVMLLGMVAMIFFKNALDSDIPMYIYITIGSIFTLIMGSRDW